MLNGRGPAVKWFRIMEVVVPALVPMAVIFLLWPVFEYVPQSASLIVILSAVPFLVQVVRWMLRRGRLNSSPPNAIPNFHPFGLGTPVSLLLVLPLWPLGEWVAQQIPALCDIVAGSGCRPLSRNRTVATPCFSLTSTVMGTSGHSGSPEG
mgnify:CR=1 FL=1